MTINLDTLRKTAEAATPGPWEMREESPQMDGRNFTLRVHGKAGIRMSAHCYGFSSDPEFIATFDPPTVLALLSRLEQAEQDRDKFRDAYSLQAQELEQVEHDRDAALEANKRWAHRSSRETSALRKANASIARVRALRNTWCEASYDPMDTGLSIAGTVNAIDRALDGDGRG